MKSKILWLSILLVIAFTSKAQSQFRLYMNGGVSNFKILNQSYLINEDGYPIKDRYSFNPENFYTYRPAFSVEAGLVQTIKNTRISFEEALIFETLAYQDNVEEEVFPSYTREADSWEERFYGIGLPLRAKYGLYKWFDINLGLCGMFHVGNKSEVGRQFKCEPFRLRGELGADFKVFNHLILGCNFSHDITPIYKLDNYKVSYRFQTVSIRLGYMF